jgi:hypothetical protein
MNVYSNYLLLFRFSDIASPLTHTNSNDFCSDIRTPIPKLALITQVLEEENNSKSFFETPRKPSFGEMFDSGKGLPSKSHILKSQELKEMPALKVVSIIECKNFGGLFFFMFVLYLVYRK